MGGKDAKTMYGTLFNMRAKPGREPQLIDIFNHWDRKLKHNMKGAVGGLLFKPDGKPEEFVGIVVFRDKKTYLANADNPEHVSFLDRWGVRGRDDCLTFFSVSVFVSLPRSSHL